MVQRTQLTWTALMAATLLGLGGCALNPFGRGGDDEILATSESEEDENSDRVAVLALQQNLTTDLRFIGTTITMPPPFTNASWSQPGGEADHVMHHLTAAENLSRAWTAKIGRGGSKRSPLTGPPVVANDTVYTVDTEAKVMAFNAASGNRLWMTALTPDVSEDAKPFWKLGNPDPAEIGFGGGVAVDGDQVFMTSGFGFAAALNAETGELSWQTTLPAPVRNPPTAAEGKVFALTVANQLVALDQATGEELWTYESFEENARFLSTASPAVNGDLVIAPFSSGEVVALDIVTGRSLWTTTVARSSRLTALSNLNDIAGSPVIDRGGVFAISHAGQISAIDERTGRTAWEVGVGGLNMPWVAGDYVFLVSVEGQLVALARSDGAVAWTRKLRSYKNEKKKKNAITWAGPILAGGNLILVSSQGQMAALSPQNGDTVATYDLKGPVTIPPIVADGTVYVLNNDGQLEAWR